MEGEGWMEGVGWWVAERKPGRKGLAGWSGWMEGSGLGGGWKAVGAGWREVDGGRLEGGMDGVKCGSVRAVRFCVSVQRFAVFAVHRGGRFLAFRFRFAVRFAAFLNLETGLRPNSAGIPYTLLLRIEAIGFPTFGLLL